MSFQAYLDAVEDKAGRTPRQLIEEARERGLSGPQVKAGSVIDWLSGDRAEPAVVVGDDREGTNIIPPS